LEGALTRSSAVLVLLSLLEQKRSRGARVSELYLFSRQLLLDTTVARDVADALRGADPSIIYLVLDELRAAGMVEAEANTFHVTPAGAEAAKRFLREHPQAVDATAATELAATA
jgi:hypothetical protein